jgi:hypothetical protein
MILTFCSVALVDDLSYRNFVIEQFLNANREEVTALIDSHLVRSDVESFLLRSGSCHPIPRGIIICAVHGLHLSRQH